LRRGYQKITRVPFLFSCLLLRPQSIVFGLLFLTQLCLLTLLLLTQWSPLWRSQNTCFERTPVFFLFLLSFLSHPYPCFASHLLFRFSYMHLKSSTPAISTILSYNLTSLSFFHALVLSLNIRASLILSVIELYLSSTTSRLRLMSRH
jgi:hypothetical protein